MWNSAFVTQAGLKQLAKAELGSTITIDNATTGKGLATDEELSTLTVLTDQTDHKVSIVDHELLEDGVEIKLQMTTPAESYTCHQIGIWAHVDVEPSELIAVYQDEQGVYMPSHSELAEFVYSFYAIIKLANPGGLTVVIDTDAYMSMGTAYEWREEFIQELDKKSDKGHTHVAAEVTDGDLTWAAKYHGHEMEDVHGLLSALAGKADLEHTHTMDDIEGLDAALGDISAEVASAGKAPISIAVPASGWTAAMRVIRNTPQPPSEEGAFGEELIQAPSRGGGQGGSTPPLPPAASSAPGIKPIASSSPVTRTLSAPGASPSANLAYVAGLVQYGTEADEASRAAWSLITRGVITGEDELTLWATEQPESGFSMRLVPFATSTPVTEVLGIPAGGTGSGGGKPADWSGAIITLDRDTFPYDGKPHKPTVTKVMLNGETLAETTDYIVICDSQTDQGSYTLQVMGQGKHAGGSATKSWSIGAADNSLWADLVVDYSPHGFTYDGSSHVPVVNSVTLNGRTLAVTTDYTVEGLEPQTETGQYMFTIMGAGNYTGCRRVYAWDIYVSATGFENAIITLDRDVFTYDGKPHKPNVISVQVDGRVLTPTTDYLVSNNEETDVGSYSLTITGQGNYDGKTATRSWSIEAAGSGAWASAVITLDKDTFPYDGAEHQPQVTKVEVGGRTLVAETDYTVSVDAQTAVGSYTVTVTGAGNYAGGSATKNWSIVSAGSGFASAVITLDHDSFTYDGESHKPEVTKVELGEKVLVLNTDYTVSVQAQTNVGTYMATVTGIGGYAGGTASKSWSITAASGGVTLSASSITIKGVMGTKNTDVKVTRSGSGKITVAPVDGTIATARMISGDKIEVTSVRAGSTQIKVTVAADANYAAAEASLDVTVEKADGKISVSPASVSIVGLSGSSTTATIIVEAGEANPTFTFGDTQYVTVTNQGKELTITLKDNHPAPEEVVITMEESENYTAATCRLAVTMRVFSPNFADNSWEQIGEAAASGDLPETWHVGDEKELVIDGHTCHAQIIGFNHDDLDVTDEKYFDKNYNRGRKKAAITLQFRELVVTNNMDNDANDEPMEMHDYNDLTVTWERCYMRRYSTANIMHYFGDDLKGVLRTVAKKTCNDRKNPAIGVTADKLFLLSEIECFGTSDKSLAGEGACYEYYRNLEHSAENYNKHVNTMIYSHATRWWLRSCYVDSNIDKSKELPDFDFIDFSATNAFVNHKNMRHGGIDAMFSPAFCI